MKIKTSYRLIYYTIITVILLIVSGCGGGNSSEKNSPPVFNLQTTAGTTTLTDAAWVAYKDGDAAWIVIKSYSSGKYSFPVSDPAGRYSIAITSKSESGNFVQIYNAVINELPRLRYTLPGASSAIKYKLTISTKGVTAPENSLGVYAGNTGYIYNVNNPEQASNSEFTLNSGKYDIVAMPVVSGEIPGRIFIARDIDLTSDTNMNIVLGSDYQTFSFPYNYTVKMFNMPQESPNSSRTGYMGYKTRNGTWISFSKKSPTDPFQFSYPKMPDNYIWPGDMYQVNMIYSDTSITRQTQLYFGNAEHKSVYLAPEMPESAYTAGTGKYFAPSITLPAYPNVLFYSAIMSGNLPGTTTLVSWNILSTSGWLANKTEMSVPDLSSVADWNKDYEIAAENDLTSFNLYATSCNRPLLQYAAIFSANFTKLGDTEINTCMKKIMKSARKISSNEENIIREIRTDLLK